MTRIKSGNVQFGESFIVPIEQNSHNTKLQEALDKQREIIEQGERPAREILEQAQAQANQIIEEATAQANASVDEITQKAHQEGFEAGRLEGLENITQELTDKIINVENFAKSEFDIKNNIIKSAQKDIVTLVIEIARKVCAKSLETDESVLTDITINAIKALKDKEEITIIVNPRMAEKIYSISDELKERIPQLESIKIIEDNSVSPDGTIVESPLSRVDCRVKSQIDEIAEKLMAKLDSTPNKNSDEDFENREQM